MAFLRAVVSCAFSMQEYEKTKKVASKLNMPLSTFVRAAMQIVRDDPKLLKLMAKAQANKAKEKQRIEEGL